MGISVVHAVESRHLQDTIDDPSAITCDVISIPSKALPSVTFCPVRYSIASTRSEHRSSLTQGYDSLIAVRFQL